MSDSKLPESLGQADRSIMHDGPSEHPKSILTILREAKARADRPIDHDYEPGIAFHPMHTDPLCRLCGRPRKEHP